MLSAMDRKQTHGFVFIGWSVCLGKGNEGGCCWTTPRSARIRSAVANLRHYLHDLCWRPGGLRTEQAGGRSDLKYGESWSKGGIRRRPDTWHCLRCRLLWLPNRKNNRGERP